MSGATGAIIGGGIIAAGASAYGSKSASDSASAANAQNKEIAAAQRKHEKEIYNWARGFPDKDGNVSSLLPIYQNEAQLGRDAMSMYDATGAILGSPEAQYGRYRDLIAPMVPAFNQGTQLVSDIFSGDMLNQRLAENEPVASARRAVAQGQQQSVLEALAKRINDYKATARLQGYAGTGSFQQNQMLDASIAARQAASGVMTQAQLQNAMANLATQEEQRKLALSSLDLPLARAKQAIEGSRLPITAMTDTYNQRLQPFEFFRLKPASYRPTSDPKVDPVPNAGQIFGSGIAQLGGTLSNYYLNQQLIAAMNNRNTTTNPGAYEQGLTVPNTPGAGYQDIPAYTPPQDWT